MCVLCVYVCARVCVQQRPARPCYTLGGTGINYHLNLTEGKPFHLMAATLVATLAGARPQPLSLPGALDSLKGLETGPWVLSFKNASSHPTPFLLCAPVEAWQQLLGASSPPCGSRSNSPSRAWQEHFYPLSQLAQQFFSNENPQYLLQKESLVCWDWELDEHVLTWTLACCSPLPAGSALVNP